MNIYVSNLSNDTTEEDLKKIFGEYGEVTSINLIKDRNTGESKGFAFIQILGKSKAWDAINGLNQKEVKGRTIQVSKAYQREERSTGFRRHKRF